MLLRRVSVLSLLLLSLGGVVALAKPNASLLTPNIMQNFDEVPPPDGSKQRLMEELQLTKDQQQKLRIIHSKYREQIDKRQKTLGQVSQEFRSLMIGNIDPGQIRTKHQEVQQLHQQLEDIRLETMLEMRDVLTLEQRGRFGQMMEQRRGHFHNMMRHRRGE